MIEKKLYNSLMEGIDRGLKRALFLDEENLNQHGSNLMATLSRSEDNLPLNTKIAVYNEIAGISTQTPRFHVFIDDGKIELEIKFQHIRKLQICTTNGFLDKTWDGYDDVRKRITEWLDETPERNMGLTNLQRMIMAWNDKNPANEIDMNFCE